MTTIPCAENTPCIELGASADGKLAASPILNPSPCNGLKCTPTGLYVTQKQFVASNVTVEGEVDVHEADGEVLVQAGTITYTTPDCGNGELFVGIDWGTAHITNLSSGGRAELTERVDTGAGFNDVDYMVLQNLAGTPLEHAWPARATITVTPVAGNFTQTIIFHRVAKVGPGGAQMHVKFRAVFMYIWVVQPV